MRKITLWTLLASTFCLFSCTQDETNNVFENAERILNPEFSVSSSSGSINAMAGRDLASACYSQELIAGQHHLAGSVNVEMDLEWVSITYQTTGNWQIKATHMYAGTCDGIPQTRKGNPKPGVFDHATTHPDGVTTVEYQIERAFFEDCFCIAAHAEVVLLDDKGNVIQEETAWADGVDFDGNNWATYFNVCQADCDEEDDDEGGLGDGDGNGTLDDGSGNGEL